MSNIARRPSSLWTCKWLGVQCFINTISSYYLCSRAKPFIKDVNRSTVVKCSGLEHLGLAMRKPVFGISDKARLKPVSSATETSQKVEISLEANLDMILSYKPITKALNRLSVCAGWSAPLLFATLRRQVFLRRGPFVPKLWNSCINNLWISC